MSLLGGPECRLMSSNNDRLVICRCGNGGRRAGSEKRRAARTRAIVLNGATIDSVLWAASKGR